MRSLKAGPVDLLAYVRAVPLLARHPQIALAPLLAAVAQVLLFKIMPADTGAGLLGSANSSLAVLASQLIASFGLAVALIVAEAAWRRGRAPFDDAWDEARHKAGGILLAAIGFNFITYIAGILGSVLGPIGALVLTLLAYVFFVYTIPAAAIGGLPGAAALNGSLERAQRTIVASVLVTILYFFVFSFAPSLIGNALLPLLLSSSALASGVIVSLVVAAANAVLTAYLAIVLAKMYDDASYARFY